MTQGTAPGLKVIIQCAASKTHNAGTLKWQGKPVRFVAAPLAAPKGDWLNACPDDLPPSGGRTWRQILEDYNSAGTNPNGLIQAGRLYRHPAYEKLLARFGIENLYILSAGWGLVRGSYLLPDYDITFSTVKSADKWKQRSRGDQYNDFNHLSADLTAASTACFIGGKGYMPILSDLTRKMDCRKIAFYRVPPQPLPATGNSLGKFPRGYQMIPFVTARRTTWYYGVAEDLARNPSHLLP